jgi:hypothetical protein
MLNKYIVSSIILVVVILFSYVFNFYYILDFDISKKTSDWTNFSGYVGGLLGPLFSFVTIILLIRSLELQINTSKHLENELEAVYKTEFFRAFEAQFQSMITMQRDILQLLEFTFADESTGGTEVLYNVDAVRRLEDSVQLFKDKGLSDKYIKNYLELIDTKEILFNTVRSFSVVIKLIFTKLRNDNGFSAEIRKEHMITTINMTPFSQLRLLLICMQFLESHHSEYLNTNEELISTLKELGLNEKY